MDEEHVNIYGGRYAKGQKLHTRRQILHDFICGEEVIYPNLLLTRNCVAEERAAEEKGS